MRLPATIATIELCIAVVSSGVLPSEAQSRTTVKSAAQCALFTDTALTPVVDDLLKRSPTFVSQCRRIHDAGIVLLAEVSPSMDRRHQASVRVLLRGEQVLWGHIGIRRLEEAGPYLVHEIEHVIEALGSRSPAPRLNRWCGRIPGSETLRAKFVEARARRELGR